MQMTDLYQEAYGESSHEQIPNSSVRLEFIFSYSRSDLLLVQGFTLLGFSLSSMQMTDLYQEAYGESSHEQIPNSSVRLMKDLLIVCEVFSPPSDSPYHLYAETPSYQDQGFVC